MSTPAVDCFYQISHQILIGRARGTLSEEKEDALLEESDLCWRAMTIEERDEANRRIQSFAKIEAAKDLKLVDLPVEKGETGWVRKPVGNDAA